MGQICSHEQPEGSPVHHYLTTTNAAALQVDQLHVMVAQLLEESWYDVQDGDQILVKV